MALLTAILIGVALIAATCLIHYETLRVTADLAPRLHVPARAGILVVITGIFVAHLLEVSLYAIALAVMQHAGLGEMVGTLEDNAFDYFYLSLTSFTTLGVGDVAAEGVMRVVTSIEALNGFVLIGWSTAFSYPAMEKFWKRERRRTRAKP
jgi:hypothetical protein